MNKKITIIGAGNVGAHIISSAILQDIPADFLLIDQNQICETAQIMDLKDTLLFHNHCTIKCADYTDKEVKDTDIFVITAGATMKAEETRLDLLIKNTAILKSIAKSLPQIKPTALIILVSNPVDIITQVARDIFPLPKNQIFGSGTFLDTSRMRWRISERLKKPLKEINGYVIGEHGDSSLITWSQMPESKVLNDKQKATMLQRVQTAAYKIKKGKGYTIFGVSECVTQIIREILSPKGQIFCLSTNDENNFYDIPNHICLGLPCKINKKGIKKVINLKLPNDEEEKLKQSAKILIKNYQSV